jgi:hypothetical protein
MADATNETVTRSHDLPAMKTPVIVAILTLCMGAVGAAHSQPLPPLQPPPSNWCTFVEAPDGRQGIACATLDHWRQATKKQCLRAEAIGRPPMWEQDNTSPYWQAESSCDSLKTALDKVEQTAREAEETYRKALAARQELGQP